MRIDEGPQLAAHSAEVEQTSGGRLLLQDGRRTKTAPKELALCRLNGGVPVYRNIDSRKVADLRFIS
jgi:hypothetical protein